LPSRIVRRIAVCNNRCPGQNETATRGKSRDTAQIGNEKKPGRKREKKRCSQKKAGRDKKGDKEK
jgi:hypothetical protein